MNKIENKHPWDLIQKEVKIISRMQSEKIDNWILYSIAPRFRLEVIKTDIWTEYKLFTKYWKKEISKIVI